MAEVCRAKGTVGQLCVGLEQKTSILAHLGQKEEGDPLGDSAGLCGRSAGPFLGLIASLVARAGKQSGWRHPGSEWPQSSPTEAACATRCSPSSSVCFDRKRAGTASWVADIDPTKLGAERELAKFEGCAQLGSVLPAPLGEFPQGPWTASNGPARLRHPQPPQLGSGHSMARWHAREWRAARKGGHADGEARAGRPSGLFARWHESVGFRPHTFEARCAQAFWSLRPEVGWGRERAFRGRFQAAGRRLHHRMPIWRTLGGTGFGQARSDPSRLVVGLRLCSQTSGPNWAPKSDRL